VQNKDTKID